MAARRRALARPVAAGRGLPPALPLALGALALGALAALTLVRLLVAWATPLAPDEAYYWVWSRALAPGYLDAPPMVALWIRAGTALAGQGALGIRLLGPIAGALGSVLLWDAAETLFPGRRAGLVAAALLNATLLFGAGSVIMTPDTPLLFFWVGCLWALARFAARQKAAWLLAAGAFAGLALDSKYTAALLAPAILLWLLFTPSLRVWLMRPAPWLGAAIALALFASVVAWNAAHGWASFVKQGGRVEDFHPTNAIRFLGELAAGQAGLATPLVFVLCVAGAVLALRRGWRGRDPGWWLLALLTFIPALVFVQHAFGGRVQANWPAVVYPSAVIAAAGLERGFWRRLAGPAAALGFVVTGVVYAQASLAVLPLPPRLDPTAEKLAGWGGLARQVEAARVATGAGFVAADEYGLASELARTLPAGVTVVAVGPRWGLFDLPRPRVGGAAGVLVRSVRRGGDGAGRSVGMAERRRGGAVVEEYRVWRVGGGRGLGEGAVLPLP